MPGKWLRLTQSVLYFILRGGSVNGLQSAGKVAGRVAYSDITASEGRSRCKSKVSIHKHA